MTASMFSGAGTLFQLFFIRIPAFLLPQTLNQSSYLLIYLILTSSIFQKVTSIDVLRII